MTVTTTMVLHLEWLNKKCLWKLDYDLIIVSLIHGLIRTSELSLLVNRGHVNGRVFTSGGKAPLKIHVAVVLRLGYS